MMWLIVPYVAFVSSTGNSSTVCRAAGEKVHFSCNNPLPGDSKLLKREIDSGTQFWSAISGSEACRTAVSVGSWMTVQLAILTTGRLLEAGASAESV
jgi:hypothetical protein